MPSSPDNQPPSTLRNLACFYPLGLLLLVWIAINIYIFSRSASPYALSFSLWYADFRFWQPWVSTCCWLIFAWAITSCLVSLLIPQNADSSLWKRRTFYQALISVLFTYFIWSAWYNHATLPLTTVFGPIMSPFTIMLASIILLAYCAGHYFKRWQASKVIITTALLIGTLPIILGADAPARPQRVSTSTGIYDVQSKNDLLNFTAEEIRKLVKMEDDRTRGAGRTPHPILVYAFEERSFHYTGGRYDNAEIRYRLRVPQNIVPGKEYPLVVHLHGIGEAGNDNTLSLAHLHSILPLIVGPEQQDFFMLVLQVPRDNRNWTFRTRRDGNLDVLVAAMNHVLENNPIGQNRLSVFGLSSGGNGVWRLIAAYPDKFAAAVPASSAAMVNSEDLPLLKDTPIWTFTNRNDRTVDHNSIVRAMDMFNDSGGFMKLTQFDQSGHAAWRNAMDECNCFSWMIVQRRGALFNPPPERGVFQWRSLSNSFFSFFLPLTFASGVFLFQRSRYCEYMHGKFAVILYGIEEVMDESNDTEEFQIWTDATGTKQFEAKVVGFQIGSLVRLQSPAGKIASILFKQFCDSDQELIMKTLEQMLVSDIFFEWTDKTGKHTFVAKFSGLRQNDKVLLQSESGKAVLISIDRLGQVEQAFQNTNLAPT